MCYISILILTICQFLDAKSFVDYITIIGTTSVSKSKVLGIYSFASYGCKYIDFYNHI